MKMQVVGIGQRRSGTAKKTGKPYDGMSVYCLSVAKDVEGHMSESVYFDYLSGVPYPAVKVGDTIDVEYDRNGFVNDVTLDKAKGA